MKKYLFKIVCAAITVALVCTALATPTMALGTKPITSVRAPRSSSVEGSIKTGPAAASSEALGYITGNNDYCRIEYDGKTGSVYWDVYPSKSGLFCLYTDTGKSFDNYFYDYNFYVFDDDGFEFTWYNNTDVCLLAGRRYTLYLEYEHYYYDHSDVYFTFSHSGSNSPFPDVNSAGWYYEPVMYTAGIGLITGYANGYFGTSDGIQRQDFLVILARFEGVDLDEYNYSSSFCDVGRGAYYEAAVNWGSENGIVTGYTSGPKAGCFGVGDMITREQIVTFLYRYADNVCELDMSVSNQSKLDTENNYSDFDRCTDYAKEPVYWAIDRGIISGKTANTIVPYGNAQRCEVAKIMYNILTKGLFNVY